MGTRWPERVYGVGDEPDARVSLANERTLLAWLRTALALIAAGVAVDALSLAGPSRPWLAALLIVLGLLAAIGGWFRWMAAEQAVRRREPLLSARLPLLLVTGVVLVGVSLAAVVLSR